MKGGVERGGAERGYVKREKGKMEEQREKQQQDKHTSSLGSRRMVNSEQAVRVRSLSKPVGKPVCMCCCFVLKV